ncbi:hypothetical protein Tsp_11464 [Trichinella spiralis]|uniref:hypothetical protein n=1 Tax=Trichinella spiralis TaxID=6334 RepID=UPI0001EFDF43|nr:hypothetical protein Tsp_11464 [Trichinella spiralis]
MDVRVVQLKLVLLTSVLVGVNSDVLLDHASDVISSRYPSGVSIQIRPFWLHMQNAIYHKSSHYTYTVFRHLLYEKEDLKNYLNTRLAFRKLEDAVLTHGKSPKTGCRCGESMPVCRPSRSSTTTAIRNIISSSPTRCWATRFDSLIRRDLPRQPSVQNTLLRAQQGKTGQRSGQSVLPNGLDNSGEENESREDSCWRISSRCDQKNFHFKLLSTIHHFEQPGGSHLADGGGYYLFVHAEQQPLVMKRKEDRMQQGVFYCASDDREDPEVLIFVDYSTKIFTSSDLTTDDPPKNVEAAWLNLEKFVHWSPWSSCCSASPE